MTVLNYTVELRSTVYCDFDLEPFPFDIQKCQVSFYIMETDKAQMSLYDPFNQSLHSTKTYKGNGFMATVNFWMNNNTMLLHCHDFIHRFHCTSFFHSRKGWFNGYPISYVDQHLYASELGVPGTELLPAIRFRLLESY